MTLEEAVERVEIVAQATLYFRPEVTEAMEAVAKVARAFPKMLSALEAVEHPVTPEGGDMGLCAACGASEIRKHAESCKVGDALRAAREAVKP